jgi:predicted ATPase/DNA-binding CsgD family transcriptional regulator
MATVSTNLPAPLTRFVGREAELDRASVLLAHGRLLTLFGPGGAGKTRLAVQLASVVADHFPDGVWFVDFSPLADGTFVWDQVAMTLGVKDPGRGKTWAETVGRFLAPRKALLVLDNCEHLVGSAAEVTNALLAAARGLKVVATSREPLGVAGELTWAVPVLSEVDGVELFTDRARHVRPDFSLRAEDADAVRSICRRLDGLPLAIELAAARTRALAPARIAAQLKDHLRLLPSGPRTAPGRQATLLASFEWSHGLLTEAEQTLLRELSVFAGGFDLEAALAVCPAAGLELLAALADRSLVVVEARSDLAEPRYRMLETIREFAAQRLAEAGEVELVRDRHRDHYLRLAEAAEPLLLGPEEDRWRARLTREMDNMRAALAWSRDHGEAEALARMVTALVGFWTIPTLRLTDMRRWLDAAANRAADLSPNLRARIRNFECLVAISTGSPGEIPALANEALTLARAAGDKREEASALGMLGLVAGLVGGAEAMRPYLDEVLPLARATGSAVVVVQALTMFVTLRWFESDPQETRRLAEEAIAIAKTGDRHHRLDTIGWAGVTALLQGRLADATQLMEAVVAEGRPTNDLNYLYAPIFLGWIGMLRGEFAPARAAIAEGLTAFEKWEADGNSAPGFEQLATFVQGMMELTLGNPARASQILPVIVEAARSSPMRRWAAVPLVFLAEAQLDLGEQAEAAAMLDEATSLARAGAMTWALGRAARVRAELRAGEGDLQEAESLAHEALNHGREAGDQLGLVDALELLARLAAEQESNKEAIRLWAAAESRRSELGYSRFPVDRGPHEAAVGAARLALGADGFAAAWAEGTKLSAEDAIAYAARGRGERKRPTTGWASLTPSELEVVRLVGHHLNNPEIAARLFVSRATIKTHLVHIFTKLGIDSRSELAAEAVKRTVRPSASRRS